MQYKDLKFGTGYLIQEVEGDSIKEIKILRETKMSFLVRYFTPNETKKKFEDVWREKEENFLRIVDTLDEEEEDDEFLEQ